MLAATLTAIVVGAAPSSASAARPDLERPANADTPRLVGAEPSPLAKSGASLRTTTGSVALIPYYLIQFAHSGKCVTAPADGRNQLYQWGCQAQNGLQYWA